MVVLHLRSYFQTWMILLLCLLTLTLANLTAAAAATLTVTNTNSSGTGSLSQAISSAASGDVIVFDPSVSGTISGSFNINSDLTIQGPSANKIILSASSSDRVLNINSGTVSISNLTFTGGNSSNGGGIYTNGPLTLTGCTVSGNTAQRGGGVYGDTNGVLTLVNCTIADNNASSYAGGILCKNTLTLTSCTVVGNSSASSGGGINSSGSATLTSSIIALNTGGDLSGSVTSSGSNIVSDPDGNGLYNGMNNDQTGLNTAALKLGTLADNGGPTSTMLPQATSPAVAGDYNNPTAADQRGDTRTPGRHTIGAADSSAAPPTPANDSYTVNEHQLLAVAAPGVLTNDSDPQGQTLTAGSASTQSHGSVTLNADGSFHYLPVAGFLGTDSFTYQAINASGIAATATVTITVTPPTVRLVSPTGSDSNNGDPTHPMLTIQAAINASMNGDTVLIANGTYTGPGDVDLNFNGENITVTSQHGAASAIINCGGSSGGSNDHRGFILNSGETNAVISGLTIENGYESADFGGGIYIVNTNSGLITLSNCILANNTSYYGGGGILCENDGSCAITVTNCVLTGNQTIYDVGGGIYALNNNSPIKVINCTLSGNTAPSGSSGGIFNYTANASFPIALTNDIIYGDTGGEIVNDVQSVIPAAVSYCDVSGGYSGTGNLNADPLFVTASTDLHLHFGSPCLGAGTATGAPTRDMEGNTRSTPPAIGAYDLPLTLSLQSIAIMPSPLSLAVGTPQVLTLTATYSDSSTANVTSQATWASLNPTVVTVDNTGLATPHAAGLSVLSAAFGGLTATAPVTVTNSSAATGYGALWARTDGEFSVWEVPLGGGSVTPHDFDAVSGFAAQALAMTSDGHAHVLLSAADGTALLDDDLVSGLTINHNAGTQITYGPYPGWTPQTIAAGPDGLLHLLWAGTGGSMSFWTLLGNTAPHREYGPYPNWTPQFLSIAPDNTARILWTNTDGRVAFWVVDVRGRFQHFEYGPYTGWTPSALATGPDGLSHITWNHASDGQTSLWTMTDTGRFRPAPLGTYTGWTAACLAVGGDDTLHLGWAGTGGTASLWDMPDTAPQSFTHTEYGPFPDTGWSLQALSATP